MARRKKATMTDRQVIERAQRIAAQYCTYTKEVAEDPREAAHVVECHADKIRTLLSQEQVMVDAAHQKQVDEVNADFDRRFGRLEAPITAAHLSQSGNPAMIVSMDPNE